MFLLLGLHLGVAVVAGISGRLGRRVFWLAALAPLATVVWAAMIAPQVLAGTPQSEVVRWVPDLGLDLALRLDAFALVMVILVAGTGTLVLVYARAYFPAQAEPGPFTANLVGFAGAMLGLVLSDNLLALFAFWELTSVTSYLLIGLNDRDAGARAAARQALLTTGVGGLAMLAGFVLLAQQTGTYTLSMILADPPAGPVVDVALLLVLAGAFTKSAHVPFHSWLPAAMAAPTPVSAYLHSATMVTAGVYLVARLTPAFAHTAVWSPTLVTGGVATMLLGAWRALRQHDLKLLLAYGTVSQLGFMTVLFSVGHPEAIVAGVAVLVAHAGFKAALFMVTGIVDHEAGTRDFRRLTGLCHKLPGTCAVAAVAAASMAGMPPLFGFVAKEAAYGAFTHDGLSGAGWLTMAALAAGSTLTVAYTARFLWGAFGTKRPSELSADPVTRVTRPTRALVAPPAILAGVTIAAGLAPSLVDSLVVSGARALGEIEAGAHLTLWHGLSPALGLSAFTLAAGLALWAARARVERLQARLRRVPDAAGAYRAAVDAVGRVADRVTGFVQPGSLPVYLAVILLTALAVPGPALITSAARTGGPITIGPPLQLAVAVIVAGATLALVRSQRRFAAVLLLGAVGYGVAVLFILQGAPDLALTQLLVETLTLVLFVLVLRHLPERFRMVPWRLGQRPRVAIAAAVGLFVAVFSLVAVAARSAEPVSNAHLEQAYTKADGRNVVNVILVDFRGFDTLGEIVVLTVAALGMTGLVRVVRRERQLERADTSGPSAGRFRSSPVLDAGVRVLFHTLLVFSVFLLVAGHNRPGGGFIGGLVAGAGLVLVHVSGSHGTSRAGDRLRAERLLGAGIALAAGTGVAAWLAGGEFLESGVLAAEVPVVGTLKATSALAFDAGVYLVVVGLVVALLRSLGREAVRPA